MAPEPLAPLAPGARCATHPAALAVATCSRCGTFLCGACTELLDEAAYCEACVHLLKRSAPSSLVVRAIIALGLAGLVLLPVPFVLGFGVLPLLAVQLLTVGLGLTVPRAALRRIQRGEAPPGGRAQARVAVALAWANLVPLLLMGAAVGFALLTGLWRVQS